MEAPLGDIEEHRRVERPHLIECLLQQAAGGERPCQAKGEAESIRIRGEALKLTPAFIELQIVEKWDGKAPLVINGNGASGANILLPLTDLQKQRAAQ